MIAGRGRGRRARGVGIDRARLLDRLLPVVYEPPEDADDEFGQADLSQVLLSLARVDQEREYQACQAAALHLLGEVPEPIVPDQTDLAD